MDLINSFDNKNQATFYEYTDYKSKNPNLGYKYSDIIFELLNNKSDISEVIDISESCFIIHKNNLECKIVFAYSGDDKDIKNIASTVNSIQNKISSDNIPGTVKIYVLNSSNSKQAQMTLISKTVYASDYVTKYLTENTQ